MQKQPLDLRNVDIQLLQTQLNFTSKTVKHHIATIWEGDLKHVAEQDFNHIKQTSGHLLRGDHTYKFVKSLGAWDATNDEWVRLQ